MTTLIQPYTLEQLVQDIKRDLMIEVIVDLKNTKLSIDQARELARDFLNILPPINKEELLKKLGELGKVYKEVRAVFIKYARLYDDEKRWYSLEQAHTYLQEGNVYLALRAVKGGVLYG